MRPEQSESQTADRTKPAEVLGTWSLVSFELRYENGSVVRPFGEHPRGMIVYTEEGRFSAQLMRSDRPAFASPDQMKGTPEEIDAAFRGCISYFGTYRLYPGAGVVMHHVEGSLFPNWEGNPLKRIVSVDGDRMELSTPPTVWGGGSGTMVGVIRWERINGPQGDSPGR